MNRKCLIGFAALLVLIGCTTSAFAGWTVTTLNPTAGQSAAIRGNSAGQQVGEVDVAGKPHASLWSGTAGSFVDLHPAGTSYSRAYAVSGGCQVGSVQGNSMHAALWTGTAASFVDLNPAGSIISYAYGATTGMQVGTAQFGAYLNAGLWRGTSASWANLHPAGAVRSEAYAVSDGQQVGWADYGTARAALWTGTASSFVDLTPADATRGYALGVSNGQQVGYVEYGTNQRAALWNGTAASFVNLHPVGYTWSVAADTSAGYQAGAVYPVANLPRASLWHGTANSFVDLHSMLGAGYSHSQAMSIDVVGNDIWVAGYARTAAGYNDAILWHNVVPEPSSFLALGSGLLALGGLIRRRR